MPSPARRLDQVPELPPCLWIEPRRGLIKEEQLRAADDAERNVKPAPLPAGQLMAAACGEPAETD